MKNIFFASILMLAFISCKNAEENKVEEITVEAPAAEVKQYRGEFIYMADAAVLKGEKFIYAVAMNDIAAQLAEQVKPIKEDEFDMVPVIVKGTLAPKPAGQEGWDEILTITEILHVSKTPAKPDVKLEEKKN